MLCKTWWQFSSHISPQVDSVTMVVQVLFFAFFFFLLEHELLSLLSSWSLLATLLSSLL